MNGSLQGAASSSGNDDTSLSLVPTGRFKVELPKFLCNIIWLLLSIYMLYYLKVKIQEEKK